MLNQKKLSLLIAAGLAVSLSVVPVFAEEAPPAGDQPTERRERGPRQSLAERLEAELKLTEEQKANVQPILVETQAQLNDIRKDENATREEKQAKRLQIIEALPAKVNPHLNDDQKETLAKFVERMKNPPERREGGWRNREGGDRGQRGQRGERGQRGDRQKPQQ